MATGNVTAAALGALFLWLVWRVRWRQPANVLSPEAVQAAREELRVPRVMTLGLSNLLNLIFLNADILLLGRDVHHSRGGAIQRGVQAVVRDLHGILAADRCAVSTHRRRERERTREQDAFSCG